MRADIVPLCFRDACFIAANIRQQDWDECRCQMDEENKFALANLCYFGTADDLRWCARLDKQPVAAFGAVRSGPGQYQLWMWSTPRLLRVFPILVKFLDGEFRSLMHKKGARRVEVRSMVGHDFQKRGYFEKAGAAYVCDLPQTGKNGESFRLYAWWKGMPNGKDVRSGYARVRGPRPDITVRDGLVRGQHCGDGVGGVGGWPGVPVNDVSDSGSGREISA